jgi:hypothetical protein
MDRNILAGHYAPPKLERFHLWLLDARGGVTATFGEAQPRPKSRQKLSQGAPTPLASTSYGSISSRSVRRDPPRCAPKPR